MRLALVREKSPGPGVGRASQALGGDGSTPEVSRCHPVSGTPEKPETAGEALRRLAEKRKPRPLTEPSRLRGRIHGPVRARGHWPVWRGEGSHEAEKTETETQEHVGVVEATER